MITLQNADAALKDYYLEAVTEQLNNSSPFFKAIEKTSENVVGKDVKIAVIRNNYGSVIAGDEDGELPSPYSNRYFHLTSTLKNLYGTVEVSDKAFRASRETSGAFVNLMNAEMEGLVNGAKANFSRMLFGNGNGFLFNITATLSDKKVSVDLAKKCYEGLKVDLLCKDDAYRTGLTIEQINFTDDGTEVVFDEIIGSTLPSGAYAAISGVMGKELCGLAALFDGETVYGHGKFEDYYFNPYIKRVSGTVSEEDLLEVIDMLDAQFDSKVNMIICSPRMKSKIASVVSGYKLINYNEGLHHGYTGVYVNDIPVYADNYCPEHRIYFLNTDDFTLNQLCDWEWLEDEDGKILKQVAGKAAYTATLVKYAELICKKPCGQGAIYVE